MVMFWLMFGSVAIGSACAIVVFRSAMKLFE